MLKIHGLLRYMNYNARFGDASLFTLDFMLRFFVIVSFRKTFASTIEHFKIQAFYKFIQNLTYHQKKKKRRSLSNELQKQLTTEMVNFFFLV
jgi:hypothetical protein